MRYVPSRPAPSCAAPEQSEAFRLKICVEGQRDLCAPSPHDEEAYLIYETHPRSPEPGPVALEGFPGERFSEIGARVKAGSPFRHTLFSDYTNDYLGYVPIADAYPEGGYEVDTSPFLPDTPDRLVEGSLALLRDLADG